MTKDSGSRKILGGIETEQSTDAAGNSKEKFTAQAVPFSSVVGSSISLIGEDGSVAAILGIMVPNPRRDYRATAEAVVAQITAALK